MSAVASNGSGGPRLSVVIPAYNEATRLPRTLERCLRHLGATFDAFELIVVDDGSADGTSDAAAAVLPDDSGRVITFPSNRGKGAAVREGMLAARGDLVLFTDADLSAPIEEERVLRAAIDAGVDVAIGSRALGDSRITRTQNVVRQSMGRIFNVLVRGVGLSGFRDTQCGFKMFTRSAARTIFSAARIDGFAFDVEILVLAQRAGLGIAEVPVEWHNDPLSRVRMLTDSARMVVELARIRWRFRRSPPHLGEST